MLLCSSKIDGQEQLAACKLVTVACSVTRLTWMLDDATNDAMRISVTIPKFVICVVMQITVTTICPLSCVAYIVSSTGIRLFADRDTCVVPTTLANFGSTLPMLNFNLDNFAFNIVAMLTNATLGSMEEMLPIIGSTYVHHCHNISMLHL